MCITLRFRMILHAPRPWCMVSTLWRWPKHFCYHTPPSRRSPLDLETSTLLSMEASYGFPSQLWALLVHLLMLCVFFFSPEVVVAFVVQVFYAYRISVLAKSKAVAILTVVVSTQIIRGYHIWPTSVACLGSVRWWNCDGGYRPSSDSFHRFSGEAHLHRHRSECLKFRPFIISLHLADLERWKCSMRRLDCRGNDVLCEFLVFLRKSSWDEFLNSLTSIAVPS